MPCSAALTWRTRAGSTKRSPGRRNRKAGPTVISSVACCWRKSRIGSKRVCSAARGTHTFLSSRRLKSSISLHSRSFGNLLGSYLGPDFVTEGRSLILHGKTGRGKTHLAVAIGYRAIQNGFEALFTTAAELIEDLSNASQKGHLHQSLTTYTHPHVLVVDEVGYLTYGPDAANVLFHVVNVRHLKKRPMIFTTNKPLHQWGRVLHDEDLAAAILDRILERGRLLHLDGPSHRTRHLQLEQDLSTGARSDRISETGLPQFPEPTPAKRPARPDTKTPESHAHADEVCLCCVP